MSNNDQETPLIEYSSQCYEVEEIRDRKFVKGKKYYLIKWMNWDDKDNTWQPIQNLQTVINMVKDYDKQYEKRNQTIGNKKDNTSTPTAKQSLTANIQVPKKTKQIEKDKKIKKAIKQDSSNEVSENQSQPNSESSEKSARKKKDISGKKIVSQSNQNSAEKMKSTQRAGVREKDKQLDRSKIIKELKQRQKQRQKQKEKQRTSDGSQMRKHQSNSNAQSKQVQQSGISQLNKQNSNKMLLEQTTGDIIEITRINYHLMIPSQISNQVSKLFYNVDRRNRITKKLLPVIDMPSEQVLSKNVTLVVDYLENYIKQVESFAMQEKQYESKSHSQNITSTDHETRLGLKR